MRADEDRNTRRTFLRTTSLAAAGALAAYPWS
ncbi:MAG: twin-arginine translocation signal domain-containing protein [Planctomycetota bacterium]